MASPPHCWARCWTNRGIEEGQLKLAAGQDEVVAAPVAMVEAGGAPQANKDGEHGWAVAGSTGEGECTRC
jgi:hypothetical protein